MDAFLGLARLPFARAKPKALLSLDKQHQEESLSFHQFDVACKAR